MHYFSTLIKLLILLLIAGQGHTLFSQVKTLSNDGAWCWFSGPSAIYMHNNADEIITGWVTSDGSIETAILNLKTEEKNFQNVSPQLEIDDHDNPSFTELNNGEILMSYTKHSDNVVRIHHMNPEDKRFGPMQGVNVNNEAMLKLYPRKGVTYANPIQLTEENNRLFIFGRWTGFKPNMMWGNDFGRSFEDAKVFITNYPFKAGNRPYVRYYSDGKSKIHIVFTDGHPRNEPVNSVYYACYEKGAFWKVDGTKICDLTEIPFEPKDATIVYKAAEELGRAWVYDIAADKEGQPVILYARYPTEQDHIYHYTRYDGKRWTDYKICHSGKWFPQTQEGKHEREPHYSAGMTIHPLKTNAIYLSREINGVFEIEKRLTKDNGKTWEITAITRNSKYDNVRPVFPRNMQPGDIPVLLWMKNEKYIHYTNYKTAINYFIDN